MVGQDLCLVLCRQASVKFQTKSVVMHGATDLGPMHVSHDAAHSLKLARITCNHLDFFAHACRLG